MKQLSLAATLTVAVFVSSASAMPFGNAKDTRGVWCLRTFNYEQGRRAIIHVYAGTRRVRKVELAHLSRYVRCQHNQMARKYLRRLWKHRRAMWEARRTPPMTGPVIASWYSDAGGTGCGFHTTYGIATLIGVPCGGRVRLCHGGQCVTATRDDSGPYVSGRVFDLNPTVKAALGCGDLCEVTYRVL